MEYTRSVGDYYESFEGTSKEIVDLIEALDKSQSSPKVKIPKFKIPHLSNMMRVHPNEISKGVASGVASKGLKGGER